MTFLSFYFHSYSPNAVCQVNKLVDYVFVLLVHERLVNPLPAINIQSKEQEGMEIKVNAHHLVYSGSQCEALASHASLVASSRAPGAIRQKT